MPSIGCWRLPGRWTSTTSLTRTSSIAPLNRAAPRHVGLVAYLRAGSESITGQLRVALERREVVVCGPVVAELIAGARPHDRPTLLGSLGGLRWAGLDRLEWQSVGLLAAELRDRGEVLPLTDVEIAVAAHGARAVLWTADPHFERLAALLDGLELRLIA